MAPTKTTTTTTKRKKPVRSPRSQTPEGAALQAKVVESIERAITREGISRAELGRRVGITKPAMTALLKDEGNMTVRSVARLAEGLGYTVEVKFRKPRAES